MPLIERDFGSLYYRARGEGMNVVILLHDFFGTHQSWENQALQLSRYCLVLAPDLRGHGRSVLHDGGLSITEMANDIIALMDNSETERAHLVGCSHGAVIALHLARTMPDRVASIVITSVPDLADPKVIEYGREYVASVFPRLELGLEQIHGEREAGYAREVLLANFVSSLDTPPADHLDALGKANEIRVPALMLGGDSDPVLPPARALHLAQQIPKAAFAVLPNTGHLAQQEAPALYTEMVADHLWRTQTERLPDSL